MTSPDNARPPEPTEDERTGVLEYVREAWTQALTSVNAGEEEVQKIVARLGNWVEGGPEEARRLAAELTERLRVQREEAEEGLNAAVRRAVAPFRLPSPDDVQELTARVDRLEERLAALAGKRR